MLIAFIIGSRSGAGSLRFTLPPQFSKVNPQSVDTIILYQIVSPKNFSLLLSHMNHRVTARDRSYQEIELLQREMQQLKETIAALRSALEEAEAGQETAAAKAMAESNQEITHLKGTVMALREELEQLKIEGEQEVEEALATGHAEFRHIQNTIRAMRHELELRKILYQEALQTLERTHRNEMGQLAQTIAALREKLEASHAQKG